MASIALLSQWQATGLCSRDRSHHAAVDGICFGRPATLKADCRPHSNCHSSRHQVHAPAHRAGAFRCGPDPRSCRDPIVLRHLQAHRPCSAHKQKPRGLVPGARLILCCGSVLGSALHNRSPFACCSRRVLSFMTRIRQGGSGRLLALKSGNARPGLTTAVAVTQTFNGWIRPAACASIGVR
jgi:hypothetical protein